jgi:hypothetical protein
MGDSIKLGNGGGRGVRRLSLASIKVPEFAILKPDAPMGISIDGITLRSAHYPSIASYELKIWSVVRDQFCNFRVSL